MAAARSSPSRASRPCTGEEIRKAFLDFYAERGHQVIPSASLIPEDSTVLLTIAGMLPFKPVFRAGGTTISPCHQQSEVHSYQ